MSFGKYFSSNNEYKKSNSFYTLATKISFELDTQCYFNYAENLKVLDDLDGSLNSLQKAYNIYPFNPMIQ